MLFYLPNPNKNSNFAARNPLMEDFLLNNILTIL